MSPLRLSLIEHGRAAEWLTSLALVALALTLALPGDTFSLSTANALAALRVEEATVGVPIALIGMARITALYINGGWRRSPSLRCAGAILGAGIYGALSMAYAWPSLKAHVPLPTAAGLYLVLAGFDALAAYRSGADARLARIADV